MTGTTQSSGGAVDPLISKNKRRRRRKRRNKDNVDKPVVSKRQEVNVDTPPLITDSVTANKLVNYSSDSTSDEDGSTKYPKLELPSFIKGLIICKIIDPSKIRLCSPAVQSCYLCVYKYNFSFVIQIVFGLLFFCNECR